MEIECKHTEAEKRFVDYLFTEELFATFCKQCDKQLTKFNNMKIELKTNPDGIITLKNVLQGVYNSEPQVKLEKVVKCVLMDVVDKIESKAKDLQRKQSLFDTKKKICLSLKYSQAFYLAHFLLHLPESENDFEKNQVHKLILQLDQKLC